jgi:cellulose biosynthesis protein BcsQ
VPHDRLGALGQDGTKLLRGFLSAASAHRTAKLLDYAVPLPQFNPGSRLVATTDRLAYAELSQTVQWLMRVGGTRAWSGQRDGRMLLRRALHAKSLSRQFDIVFLDCPPLINLCCANALAASDYVLTPVTPSVKAVERVTPLLRRVLEVKTLGVNPDLHMLGVVVNNHQERELTARERDVIRPLPQNCRDVYQQDVYMFDTSVPQRVGMQNAEVDLAAAGEAGPLGHLFEQMAQEAFTRLPGYCRAPADGVRRRSPAGGVG